MKKVFTLILALAMVISILTIVSADEPTVLKVAVPLGSTNDLETIPMYKEIAEKAGVTIEWQYYRSDWDTIKSTMFASGDDLPDIFFGREALSIDDIQRNIDYFVPLENLVVEYCPNIQKMYEEYPNTKALNTFSDGHTYALGHVMAGRPSSFAAFYVNKLWLEKVNMTVPTTIDELTEVLRAFKAYGDLNGNGEADEILFTISEVDSTNFGARAFVGSFGVHDSLDSWLALDDNGKVIYNPATENYKKYLNWIHSLYAEGLVDQECLYHDWSQFWSKNQSTAVGVRVVWDISNFPNGDDYELILPLTGPDGYRFVSGSSNFNKLGTDNYNVVSLTTTCKNPEAAMRWLDYFYSDEYGVQSYWGSYGEGLQKNADGTIDRATPPEGYTLDNWGWVCAMNDCFVGYISPAVEETIRYSDKYSLAGTSKLDVDKAYKPYVDETHNYPSLVISTDLADELALLATDIEAVRSMQQAQWIANGGIDEGWETYQNDLKNAGLDRFLEIYQEAYNTAIK